jgi:hypothetical protein
MGMSRYSAAPVVAHQHDVIGAARRLEVLREPVEARPGDVEPAVVRGELALVPDLRHREQGDRPVAAAEHHRLVHALRLAGRADRRHPRPIEVLEGAEQGALAVVPDVVVRQRHRVDTGRGQDLRTRGRSGEDQSVVRRLRLCPLIAELGLEVDEA